MLSSLVLPILGVLLPFLAQPAASFNPSWAFTLYGALGHPHEQMTYQGLTDKYQEYFGVSEFSVTNSINLARKQIIDGTKIVDRHGDVEAELSEAHCDDESLQLCHERLKSNLTVIRTLLEAGNVAQARDNLGRMLHTLQDFYSHSNWIELGMTDISHNLAQQWPLEKPVDDTQKVPSCNNCTYPGTPDFAVDWELRWDDFVRRTAVLRPGAIKPDPMSTVTKSITGFLMGLKKFSVSIIRPIAKAYLAEEVPEELIDALADLGDNLLNVKPDCTANLKDQFTSLFLTTGYFGVDVEIHTDHKPPGKCSHGGPFDRDARGIEGISKDTASDFFSPRHDLHPKAAALAYKATKQYLDYLKTSVCADTPAKDCVLLKALYGVGPSLTFVIDTTGSMGSVIAAVRDAAIRIVNEARTLGVAQSPSLYVLAPFNDPDVPAATTFTDPDRFIDAILALGASGGGDCPELAMTGLQNAVAATPAGGKIFLWTDAGAKDFAKAGDVAHSAANKSLAVTVFQFDSGCQTVDGFDTVTRETSGFLYTGLTYARAGATADLAKAIIVQDSVGLMSVIYDKLLNAGHPLFRRAAAPRSVTLEIPIDPSVSFVGFSANSSDVTMIISRPDGSVLDASEAGVTVIDLGHGVTETIASPASGKWKVTLTGDAAFSFSAFGTTTLLFSRFEFVEDAGARHDGYFPLSVPPVPGTEVLASAGLEGTALTNGSVVFEFRALDGTVLDTVTGLAPGSGADMDMPSNLFLGNVTVPTQSFNVYVRGKDAGGQDFLRVLPGLLNITPSPASNETTGRNVTASSMPPNITPSPTSNGTTSKNATASSTPPNITPSPASNGTTGNNMTASSMPPYANATMTATGTSTATVCPTCQPEPCSTAVTELVRTIVYYTTCPGENGAPSSALATTTIAVPCYSNCPSSLAVISPGCTGACMWPVGSVSVTAGVGTAAAPTTGTPSGKAAGATSTSSIYTAGGAKLGCGVAWIIFAALFWAVV